MQHRRSDASNTRNQLPPLAPRGLQVSPVSGQNTAASTPGGTTRPRLSHRSRAGCWTCRKRKVKCDEVHPKCGPCTRLSKDCDWEFRWKFDDVTSNTQNKYNNVSTAGNAVWDPQASSSSVHLRSSQSPIYDDLPSFSDLTNDEDRERKAESKAPGTYNVIVNPQSFASLPEYGRPSGTRPRTQSIHSARSGPSGRTSPSASSDGSRGRIGVPADDPDTVVLSRFEDVSLSMPSLSTFPPDRRTSLPDTMQRLEITISPRGSSLPSARGDPTGPGGRNERLMVHYRGFIAKRIMPMGKNFYLDHGPGHEDPIVAAARTFPPLYHAICAVCLLSLALKGQQQLLPEAFQHYHQAISSSLTSPSDLNSDRLLYLHFLLLVYDISYATQIPNLQDGFNMNMWIQHMHHIIRIAQNRNGEASGELQAYLLWYALYLDTQACLAGNGSGDFVRAFMNHEIVLPDWRALKVPIHSILMTPTYPNEEKTAFAAIYNFSNGTCALSAKLAALGYRIREESAVQDRHGFDPQVMANRGHLLSQLRNEHYAFWNKNYPSFIVPDSPHAAAHLPNLARIVFEFTFLQFNRNLVYLYTSMYPQQQRHNGLEIRAEIAHRCAAILSLGTSVVEAQNFDQHHIIFPMFMAGFATPDLEAKMHAVNLMRAMEGTGISRNATRSRELLVAVCEEQRTRAMAGDNPDDVDWVSFAKSRGLGVVNFGL